MEGRGRFDAPVPVEDLDRCSGDPDIDLAAGQGVGTL